VNEFRHLTTSGDSYKLNSRRAKTLRRVSSSAGVIGIYLRDKPIREIMTLQIYCVHPSSSSEECMALMTDKRIRHLPVIEKDKLVGVISIGDVVKSIISQQKVTIQHLENYIMGKYQ
jgi:CBS domain-containing protein